LTTPVRASQIRPVASRDPVTISVLFGPNAAEVISSFCVSVWTSVPLAASQTRAAGSFATVSTSDPSRLNDAERPVCPFGRECSSTPLAASQSRAALPPGCHEQAPVR